MFGQLIATLKKSPKTIVFTEGTDPRILEASARLLSGNFLKPVLVGNPEEIAAAAEDAGFNIRGAEIADPANYPEMDAMVEQMVELRKGKMTKPLLYGSVVEWLRGRKQTGDRKRRKHEKKRNDHSYDASCICYRGLPDLHTQGQNGHAFAVYKNFFGVPARPAYGSAERCGKERVSVSIC